MTTAELESRLAELLRERAEGAMKATNTPEKLSGLLEDEHARSRQHRKWWIGGGAVAAAAALAVAIWLTGDDNTTIQPAPIPDSSAAETVATQYLENYWSYDLAAVEAAVTEPEVLSEHGNLDQWHRSMAWLEAAGFSLANSRCEEGGRSARADGIVVHCDYEIHGLGSELVGTGPYAGRFDISVQDGKVTSAVDDFDFIGNGFSDHSWEPFAHYVARTHPDDVDAMYDDPNQGGKREGPASRRLWTAYIDEYVAYLNG